MSIHVDGITSYRVHNLVAMLIEERFLSFCVIYYCTLLCVESVASYPGLPLFFNAHEKNLVNLFGDV